MKTLKMRKLPAWHWLIATVIAVFVMISLTTWAADTWESMQQSIIGNTWEKQKLQRQIGEIAKKLRELQSQDQVLINRNLNHDIQRIEDTYSQTVVSYEELLQLKAVSKDTKKFDEAFSNILALLAKRNYASASAQLSALKTAISTERNKIAESFTIPADVSQSNVPPGSGFSRQSVSVDIGTFLVDIVAADMGSTRVIVDTASDGTCMRDCPVKSLAEYVARSGAIAGINGSYFCPADYPSCADKKNSFDTLLMNKNKVYFNSENNVYSTLPVVIFQNGSMRFIGRTLDWGRDTGVDGVISNQPLLVSGGTVVFGGSGDPKQGSKGSRSFIANKGSIAYIGVVHNSTVAEVARVLKALGVDNAMNLDSGGSTALWSGGYKAGPGRGIPNAILFIRK